MVKYINKIPLLVSQKEVRDRQRYRQKEIAKGTGLSESMISRLMREEELSAINYVTARAIARWLGVSTDDLADEEDSA
jgi:transcriptional regulator with XRE-family HTH domain